MIPMVLSEGGMSYIYVQTKTGATFTRDASPNEIAASSPYKAFGRIDYPVLYIYHHITAETRLKASIIEYENKENGVQVHNGKCLFIRGFDDRTGALWNLVADVVEKITDNPVIDKNPNLAITMRNPAQENPYALKEESRFDLKSLRKKGWNNATTYKSSLSPPTMPTEDDVVEPDVVGVEQPKRRRIEAASATTQDSGLKESAESSLESNHDSLP